MPFDIQTSRDTARIVAYVCTDAGAAVARSVIEQNGGNRAHLHGGGLSGAARLASEALSSDILLAEIGNLSVDMACECVTELCTLGARVIVMGAQTDMTTYRALRRAGALEYFTYPVTADEILEVQQGLPASRASVTAANRSLSIGVVGCKGGVGASLLAQNLAFHAASAKGGNRRTALIDADLQFGSHAIDLDRDETRGLFEALKAPDRIDDTFISATMEHLNDRLSLYSHQIRLGQDARPYDMGLPRLLRPIGDKFAVVITDIPRDVLVQQPEVVARLDALIVVIPTGFAGVNAASRLIEWANAQNPDLRILPVISDLRADAALSRKDITTSIGRGLAATLPRCDVALTRAHRAARPMAEHQPGSPYAKAIGTIWAATIAAPAAVKPARRSFIKRVFG